jgi:hypothetical protein
MLVAMCLYGDMIDTCPMIASFNRDRTGVELVSVEDVARRASETRASRDTEGAA